MSIGAEGTPAAPGTGGDTDPAAGTPAGALNTDNGGGQAPDTVPYSRFKEVNDSLVQYKGSYGQLEELGYDADSLRQLVGFEVAYQQNPTRVLNELVEGLGDLPPEAKAAIKEHLGAAAAPPAATQDNGGQQGGENEEPPAWAKPLIEDHVARQTQREADDRSAKLDEVIRLWNDADTKDNLRTPERAMLAHIAINAPHFNTTAEIAEAARKDYMGVVEEQLGGERSTLRDTRATGSPLTVPAGAGLTPTPPNKIRSISEASALALAAIRSNTLPPLERS